MKYFYEPYNNQYFAANARRKDDDIKWDSNRGGFTFMVKGRYGRDVAPDMDRICQRLETVAASPEDGFVPLGADFLGMSVHILNAVDKANAGGFRVGRESCRYTLFGCRISEDGCHVYTPRRKEAVDIPIELTIACEKIYDHKKWGKPKYAGFYQFEISGGVPEAYADGDICYEIQGIKIPLTEAALEEGLFYIQTAENEIPEFLAVDDGYIIRVVEGGDR